MLGIRVASLASMNIAGIPRFFVLVTFTVATSACAPANDTELVDEDAEDVSLADGVLATFAGKRVNLAKSWEGANVCAEMGRGDVRCFASENELRAAIGEPLEGGAIGIKAVNARTSGCPAGWACLWEDIYFKGRRLMWRDPGTKNLSQWGFRDRASSAANALPLGGFILVEDRVGPDGWLSCPLGAAYDDLRRIGYYGGNWNDRADKVMVGGQ